ncbi:MAG: DUF3493 domain-containing protein [Timaviella obliquedivisa GSE-PSE-MK23-08B]|jgi:hypothetical protein|nr:DUF3493 domain-containing protein [Timaviella obliquedivisa GSE-PSE-MK23-08B]
MPDLSTQNASKSPENPRKLDPQLYAQLQAEAKAPYRGLRKFVYFACGASGAIGGVVFLTQLIAGRDIGNALPNFAFQMGIVALMVALFRWEQRAERKP